MKLDIPYYIRQVLREQRMAHIPGIGTFKLNQSPASFNDDKTVLSPPSLSISFDDAESEDQSLLKYILDTGLLTEAKAKKKIEQFTQSAFNKLLNVDSFLIDGIGTIFKRVGEEQVGFEPNLSELTREFGDLIALKLSPVSRIAEQQPAALAAESTPPVKESNSFLWRILLLTILMVSLWFLGTKLYDSYKEQKAEAKTEIDGEKSPDDEAAITDPGDKTESNEKELEQKYEEIDELIDPLNAKDENEKTKTKEIDESGNTKLNEELDNLADSEVGKLDEEPQSDVATIDEPTTITEPIEDAQPKATESTEQINTSENKHADIIPDSGECIIVVGSFIKSLNAIKMVSRLERKGYKVYQSEYKGFQRVGLKFDCTDEDLEAYLQNIRKTISKRAWYLVPNLKVSFSKR